MDRHIIKAIFQVMNCVSFSDPGDRRWVGMWWGGFLLCGLLLVMVAVPFYAFPKTLQVRKIIISSYIFFVEPFLNSFPYLKAVTEVR
jgi:hypothetical protein